MNLIKRLRKAWRAFWRKNETDADDLLKMLEKLDRFNAKVMSPEEVIEAKLKASSVAREAHEHQNTQIDEYFQKILTKSIDPMLLAIYRDSNKPIPELNANVHFFADAGSMSFGRKITIMIREKVIGEAVFTTKIKNGKADCIVEEKIKA